MRRGRSEMGKRDNVWPEGGGSLVEQHKVYPFVTLPALTLKATEKLQTMQGRLI